MPQGGARLKNCGKRAVGKVVACIGCFEGGQKKEEVNVDWGKRRSAWGDSKGSNGEKGESVSVRTLWTPCKKKRRNSTKKWTP